VERQNLPCTLDRPQQYPLVLAFRNSLVVQLNFRNPNDGDQQANHRAQKGRSMTMLADLSNQVGAIASNEIAGDHIGNASVNPASDGRAWNLQFWK
jgi:hypothetical protein